MFSIMFLGYEGLGSGFIYKFIFSLLLLVINLRLLMLLWWFEYDFIEVFFNMICLFEDRDVVCNIGKINFKNSINL